MKRLYDIKVGDVGYVKALECKDLIKERMLALGVTRGARIEVIRKGPKDNLTVYDIRGVMLALRKEESLLVLVE